MELCASVAFCVEITLPYGNEIILRETKLAITPYFILVNNLHY